MKAPLSLRQIWIVRGGLAVSRVCGLRSPDTWWVCALVALLLGAPFADAAGFAPGPGSGSQPEYHPNRILIKPKAQLKLSGASLAKLHAANGARVLRSFPAMGGVQTIELAGSPDIQNALEAYRRSGLVEYAEPDYQVHLALTPNDPQFLNGILWALNNTGQYGGKAGADIHAPAGWDVRNQASNIIVAVIDTGIRYTHQDLAANMWTNPQEIAGNGIDDDGDGYVDDVHGINVISQSGDPNDDNGHGTHVAGIIGARGNNALGTVGVAWRVQLMACKFINAHGYGYDSDAITCIAYAQAHGASVLNNSWGGGSYSLALRDAIEAAGRAGIIFVAAAGNNSTDNDAQPFYPASYDCDNIVAVAATTRTDDLAYFSNVGTAAVALGAPGLDISSTWHTSDSAYQTLSGTSMAAPHVSGAFALMRAQFPNETYLQLFNRVYGAVDPLSTLAGKCRVGGRLNLAKALTSASSRPGNDTFNNRLVVSGNTFSIRGLNVDATREPGEPNHAGNSGGKSVWWSWRAPAAGLVTITTAGSSFNTLLGGYTGSAVTNLTLVASNDDAPGGGTNTSSITFETTGGMDYAIAVDGFDGAAGDIVLKVNFQPRPLNDLFANRASVFGSLATVSGSNFLATAEPGEPIHAGVPGGKSVWWSWVPNVTGPATISTAGSDFDTLLGVYTGAAVNSLTPVASNDNDPAGGKTSRVVFTAVAGTTYQIAVDGANGASGNLVLNTPPCNDHFANALPLSGVSATAVGYNLLASREALEPSPATNGSGKTIWWSWTAPSSGTASITTIGSSFDTFLAVYTGNSLGNLWLVAANDNDPYGDFTSLVSFNAVAGTTYRIAVDGMNGSCGRVQLQAIMGKQYVITALEPPPGYTNCVAYSLNNLGLVAGTFIGPAPDYRAHACIWTNTSGFVQLMSGDTESKAADINDLNQVVGWLSRPGYSSIAFLWQNGVVRELGGLSSHPWSEAYAIDNAGRVVGWSYTSSGSLHAFLWQDGVMTDLGAVGTDRTAARGLNGRDFVVGSENYADATGQRPVVWQRGSLSMLPIPSGGTEASALSINALFQTVGRFQGPSLLHAVLWENGQAIDLGGGPRGVTEANSINNLGQIVGDSQFSPALLYENGEWKDLLSLVPAGSAWTRLFIAYKINDRGQIVGNGNLNGDTMGSRAYLMTPLLPVTPRLIITSVTNQQSFLAGEDIALAGGLVPDTANLAKVDWFVDGVLMGTAANPPYGLTWHHVPPGQHVLSARTASLSGATANSQTITITVVSPPSLSLESAPNSLRLSWPVLPQGFMLESATNLRPPVFWQLLSNPIQNLNGTNVLNFGLTNDSRFFRLRHP